MKKTHICTKAFAALVPVFLLMAVLSGCGGKENAEGASAPAVEPIPAEETAAAAEDLSAAETAVAETAIPAGAEAAEPAASGASEVSESPVPAGREDGERFEDIIILEGMEETVHYEHVRSTALGFELDYDYESFTRRSEPDRECFISVYDNPDSPENYLEVTSSAEDAETAAASIIAALAEEYEPIRESYTLNRAGDCIRIDASAAKGGEVMPEQLQMVYIIPAADGCRIATAHYAIEASEGFGRRFSYIMHTLETIGTDPAVQ